VLVGSEVEGGVTTPVVDLTAYREAREQTENDQAADIAFSAARVDGRTVVLTSQTQRLTPAAARLLGLNLVALADEAEGSAF
jgi:hypothetical protein